MVAAVGVGHITAAYDSDVATHRRALRPRGRAPARRYDSPRPIARGDELGTFHLGSTTIAVFEPGKVALDAFEAGASTKMGAFGRAHPLSRKPRVANPDDTILSDDPAARSANAAAGAGRGAAESRSAAAESRSAAATSRRRWCSKRTITKPRGLPTVAPVDPRPSIMRQRGDPAAGAERNAGADGQGDRGPADAGRARRAPSIPIRPACAVKPRACARPGCNRSPPVAEDVPVTPPPPPVPAAAAPKTPGAAPRRRRAAPKTRRRSRRR